MGLLMIAGIITLSVILDYFIFDYDDKHWGWLKKASKPVRRSVIGCYLLMSFVIYFGLSLPYIKPFL
ncbi:hypothetical protein [Priestia megaterium]|uniref:hypothetical protein n=1 Tax=Priestia megaterium TaxID=1404 RepID=UPI000D51869E|nr:hypothetical protein [Priestia megaterium]PVE71036.1 hypothetical protein DC428_11375 [Priestia megaterium]PVE89091.1 hypothetical protein DC421_03220 [Priestia megaterium]PVE92781.1 hypothetical protein DC426_04875 [Priestia megaterium]PVE99151.1 hypothetical protein DC433_15105 [Priestia megaterium]